MYARIDMLLDFPFMMFDIRIIHCGSYLIVRIGGCQGELKKTPSAPKKSMTKKQRDKAIDHLMDYMSENKLKWDDMVAIFERIRMQILYAFIMQDFNKEGSYVLNLKMDDLEEKEKK